MASCFSCPLTSSKVCSYWLPLHRNWSLILILGIPGTFCIFPNLQSTRLSHNVFWPENTALNSSHVIHCPSQCLLSDCFFSLKLFPPSLHPVEIPFLLQYLNTLLWHFPSHTFKSTHLYNYPHISCTLHIFRQNILDSCHEFFFFFF